MGLDPRINQLPAQIAPENAADLTQVAIAYSSFCCEIIDVVSELVPAVKPQAAFFEQIGPLGMAALAEVVDHASAKGLQVIMDAKRGDIGSTATAYASAFLGRKPHSSWGCDALTVNPYMGEDTLEPFINAANKNGAGIFVLVKNFQPRESHHPGKNKPTTNRFIPTSPVTLNGFPATMSARRDMATPAP